MRTRLDYWIRTCIIYVAVALSIIVIEKYFLYMRMLDPKKVLEKTKLISLIILFTFYFYHNAIKIRFLFYKK